MGRRKRYNLNIRLQPVEGTLFAEMTKWFNRMSIEEKNEKVLQALLMTYFPLVKADAGANQEELEKCYWEFEQWFYRYRFMLRQKLNVQEPFHWERDLIAKGTESIPGDEDDDEGEDEANIASLKSQLIGGGKVKNAGSTIFNGLS